MRSSSVSVIIPTYNNARYIAESIDTVLAQTHQPTEILIVDDGSTDDTQAVVSTIADPRIRYIAIPHAGISAARNKGLDLAKAEYVAFLDSDDRWQRQMLEKNVAVLANDDRLVCSFTNFVRFEHGTERYMPNQFTFYPELEFLKTTPSRHGQGLVIEGDAFIELVRFGEIPAYMQCMLFRRVVIANMRLNDSLRRCEDLEFVLRVATQGSVAYVPEILCELRRHGTNITKDISLMSLDKLNALLSLHDVVTSGPRRAALDDRIVKAHIDCATAYIGIRQRMNGLKHYWKALMSPGSPRRKIRGLARTALNLVNSLKPRRAAHPVRR